MFKNFNFHPGHVTFDDFNIDINKSLSEQICSLKEDLFQVSFFNDKYIIDIGWTNDFDIDGRFRIEIIKDKDWNKPLFSKETVNTTELYQYAKSALELIHSFEERDLV